MTKKEFEHAVAEDAGLSVKDAGKVTDAVFAELTRCIAAGDSIKIPGFGTFSQSHRDARKGRNPQTGEETIISACNVPKFKASSVLKAKCNA